MTKLCENCRQNARKTPDDFQLCSDCVKAVVKETKYCSIPELEEDPTIIRQIATHLGVAFLSTYAVLRMINSAWAAR